MLGDIILPKEEVDMIPTTGDTRLNLVCLIDAPEQLVKFVWSLLGFTASQTRSQRGSLQRMADVL